MKKLMLRILKKLNFKEAENIPPQFLFSYITERIIMLIRGIIKFRKICFIGKGVEIKCKKKIKLGKFVTIHSYTYIDACSKRGIILEDYCTIGKHNYVRTGNVTNHSGFLIMGKNSSTNYGCFLGATGGIIIGDNVLIGPNVTIISETHVFDSLDKSIKEQGVRNLPVEIENDVWIGTNVTILGGIKVKEHSIIGAYSLVNKDVNPRQIVVGIPAKPLKERV